MKEIYTTSEAAKVAKISVATVIRCFDAGLLRGFRVPGSRFRRITRDDLVQFMRSNGIPIDALGGNDFQASEDQAVNEPDLSQRSSLGS